MAPRIPNEVQFEIDLWEEAYRIEQEQEATKSQVDEAIDEYENQWNEMMKTSELLKQKYSFLDDFMKKNRINVVWETEFNKDILDNSWKITFYEDDSSWTVYFIVQSNWDIIKVPYEQIDRTWDFEVSDNWFEWEQLWDYLDENTTHILQHEYSTYWNDMSPLYVIPYVK